MQRNLPYGVKDSNLKNSHIAQVVDSIRTNNGELNLGEYFDRVSNFWNLSTNTLVLESD